MQSRVKFHSYQSYRSEFNFKVTIKPPFGGADDLIQFAEIVLPHVDESLSKKIRGIVEEIDDPFRINCSLSMLCIYGNGLNLL